MRSPARPALTPGVDAGRDAAQVFNYITGYVEPHNLEMLSMSPLGMREKIIELLAEK